MRASKTIGWRLALPLAVVLFSGILPAFSATRYVAPVGQSSPSYPYTTEATAANSIQTAVNAALDGDVIELLPGTYRPGTQTEVLYKGITIRSRDGLGSVVIDMQGLSRGFYVQSVLAVLDGLIIRNGIAPPNPEHGDSYGGGVYIFDGGTVRNSRIENCRADYGGGIRIRQQGNVEDCQITSCYANVSGGGIQMYIGGLVTGTTVTSCTAPEKGGGLYAYNGGTISESTFSSNQAWLGGGVRFYYDGQAGATFPKISRSRIHNNKTVRFGTRRGGGGGIQVEDGGTVENCLIYDNESEYYGGGVHLIRLGTIMNCTISHNRTTDTTGDGVGDGAGGGIYTYSGGTIQNTIIFDNTTGITPNRNDDDAVVVYRNCLTSPSVIGNGNVLAAPPQYVDGSARNYQLTAGSPCIDKGDNTGAPAADFAGMFRPLIGLNGGSRIVDIGAYEFSDVDDIDGDGMPTWWELQYGLDPNSASDAESHLPDNDDLWNIDEYSAGTDPTNPDTDGDGLQDGDEVYGIDDNGGFVTDPARADTDSDGFNDKYEIDNDANPTNALSFLTSITGTIRYSGSVQNVGKVHVSIASPGMTTRLQVFDGLGTYTATNLPTLRPLTITAYRDGNNTNGIANTQDSWEPTGAYTNNPLTLTTNGQTGIDIVLDDPANDTDSDGLADYEELFIHDTNYQIADTDGDGMTDGWEVQHGLDPLVNEQQDQDPDGDGLTNLQESDLNTDPNDPDTDGDGMPDGWEAAYISALDPTVDDAAGDADNDDLSNLLEYQTSTNLLGVGFDPNAGEGLNPINEDSDNDGMWDGWEASYMPELNPLVDDANGDADFDELLNADEYSAGTDPTDSDTDGDTMPDKWEVDNGLNPLDDDTAEDPDNDGLSNLAEYQWPSNTQYPDGLDPNDFDSDGDNASDGVEVAANSDPLDPTSYPARIAGILSYSGIQTGTFYVIASQHPTGLVFSTSVTNIGAYAITNAANATNYTVEAYLDGNGNASQDVWEAYGLLSDTNGSPIILELTNEINDADITLADPDTDGDNDGLRDLDELFIYFTDPSLPDTDGDSIPDGWEVDNGLDPLDRTDGDQDADGDGLQNDDEYYNGTDPNDPDTDDDSLNDGVEVLTYFTNPLLADSDSDGLSDFEEIDEHGTNPNKADTDDDGFDDGVELQAGSDPLNILSFPATLSGTITYTGTETGLIYVVAIDAATNMISTTLPVAGAYSLTNVPTIKAYTVSAYQDTTGNQVLESWEAQGLFAGNPLTPTNDVSGVDITLAHPTTDSDADGLSDYDEISQHKTEILNPDTDEDGMPDGWEVFYGLAPTNSADAAADTEPDDLTSLQEYRYTTNYFGTTAYAVITNGLNPMLADTDADGMPDGWEIHFGLDPLDAADAVSDIEPDGLSSVAEYQFSTNYFGTTLFLPGNGLSPTNSDTDADGFTDGQEVAINSDPLDPLAYPFVVSGTISYGGTQAGLVWLVAESVDNVVSNVFTMTGGSVAYSVSNLVTDTDYTISAYRDSTVNQTTDLWEARGFFSGNPLNGASNAISGVDVVMTDPTTDTDGDGLTDYEEHYNTLTEPTIADTDTDGMPDGWEVDNSLDPRVNDAFDDPDGDSLVNVDEYGARSDPNQPDTDSDGMRDDWEVHFGLSPTNALDAADDLEPDGLSNLQEYQFSTNYYSSVDFVPGTGLSPTNADSDGDSMPDGWEVGYYNDLNPLVADGFNDPDGDLLLNADEYLANTDPTNPDSDTDSYNDKFEVDWRSNPLDTNSFPVTISGRIINNTASGPLLLMTGTVYVALSYESNANHFANFIVGDVTTAGLQPPFTTGFVPTLSNYWVGAFIDLSGDGLQDGWEPYGYAFSGTNSIVPTNAFDVGLIPIERSTLDTDEDGISDYDEATLYGTDPDLADTDDDDFNDFDELFVYSTIATNAASFPTWISGSVSYAGTNSGPLVTVADDGTNVYVNTFGDYAAGAYSTATNLPTLTNYTLIAYLDLNTNGVRDLWEAWGAAAGNQPDGTYLLFGSVTDADIVLADPVGTDTDGDQLNDYDEFFVYGTEPDDPDSDDDGMPDGWEVYFNLMPTNGVDANIDADADGLTSLEEYQASTNLLSTNAFTAADGLDPTNADTDGDLRLDGEELLVAPLTNPLLADTDEDGMPDGWEVSFGLNPNVNDAFLDNDAEGLTNIAEYQFSTNYFTTNMWLPDEGLSPTNTDTDADRLTDFEEIQDYGTDPLMADSDNDGFTDYEEVIEIGSDPLNVSDPWVVDDNAANDPVPNDPNNDDYDSENGSFTDPYDSIKEAVDAANDGDTVLILDGVYKSVGNGNINLAGKAITIRSRNGYEFTSILRDSGNGFIVNSGETNNTVIQGLTIQTGVAGLGSAGILVDGASPIIRECRFFDCGEAGVYVRGGGEPLIEDSLFEHNQGAIKIEASSPRIERCTMRSNQDEFGGGMWITGTSAITSQPLIVNCLIVTNRATDMGGGVYIGAYTRPVFVHTTIADNTADLRGGGIYNASADTEFWNGILWGNTAPEGPGLALDKALVTSYSCLQVTDRESSIGIITNDPQFAGSDYRLLSTSPCIGSGTENINTLYGTNVPAPTNDISQNRRPISGYDLGAYEYQPGGAIFVQGPGAQAGQVLYSGLPAEISWTYDGALGTNVSLAYTYDFLSIATWIPIATNVYRGDAGSGRYVWQVPVTNTMRCFIRVRDAGNELVEGISTFQFSIADGVQVYAPTNGQTYYLGQTVDVAWAASPSAVTNVQFALSVDGVSFDASDGAMFTNAANVAGGGVTNTAGWFLNPSDPGFLTTNGQIRVSGSGLRGGLSGDTLTVLGLVMTIPGTDAVVLTGTTFDVSWTGLGAGTNVNIRYSDNGGGGYVVVSNGVANVDGTNVFAWTAPTNVSSNAVLEVQSTDDAAIVSRRAFVVTDDPGQVNLMGDGVPDSWKVANGLSPVNLDGQSDANADPDGDGSSNAHEWRAGTNPLNDQSVFGIVAVRPAAAGDGLSLDAGGIVLRWRAVRGRHYVVLATDQPNGVWRAISPLLSVENGVDAEAELEWTDPSPVEHRYYRIGVVTE